jgi:hypothetical protein
MDKSMDTLLGGRDVTVTRLDGSTQSVRVRQLPISELGKYFVVAEDEGATIELICSQPRGWSATLTPDSFEAALVAAEELNLDPLSRYAARVAARREKLMPGVTEKLLEMMATQSASSAPGSPSKQV